MSIFNNEEMTRLRDDVQTLQKQVHDLREVLDKVCEHLTPPCTPSPSEAEASPAMVENGSDPETAPAAEERQTTETAVPQSPLSDGKVADALQALAGKMESLGEKIDTADLSGEDYSGHAPGTGANKEGTDRRLEEGLSGRHSQHLRKNGRHRQAYSAGCARL